MSLVITLAVATGFTVSRQVFADDTVPALATAVVVTLLVVGLHRWFGTVLAYFALSLPAALVLFVSTSASASLMGGA